MRFMKLEEINQSKTSCLDIGLTEGKIQPDEHISIPGLNDCDLALNVWGDSMFPEYCSGEIIACKAIPMDKELSYVRFGEAYVAFCDDGIVLKFIKKGKDSSHLTFESKNEHYEPYQVHKSRIKNLYLVKGVITRKNL
jgi:SOS-response transcriptional repressor LexA